MGLEVVGDELLIGVLENFEIFFILFLKYIKGILKYGF